VHAASYSEGERRECEEGDRNIFRFTGMISGIGG
jgi:hypothetical protein